MGRRTVVYVHGIRDDDLSQGWLDALERTFQRQGVETLAKRGYEVVAPSYLDLLEAEAPVHADSRLMETYVRGSEQEHERAATEYFASQSELERELGQSVQTKLGAVGRLTGDRTVGPAVKLMKKFEQADRYVREPTRREAILAKVAEAVPEDGDLVIVGHSLGSVVAADLVYYVPPQARVLLFVTLGSPLSRAALRAHVLERRGRFPFERIGPWLNIVGENDVVTGGRGICTKFPEALDVICDTGPPLQKRSHSAVSYFDQEVVARALSWVDDFHGSIGKSAAAPDHIPDEILPAIVRAQYLTRIEQQMEPGDSRTRFGKARERIATDIATQLRARGYDHRLLDRLLMANHDELQGACDRAFDLMFLVLSRLSNPLEPYAVAVEEDTRRAALGELALDLGVPRSWARTVLDAESEARSAHTDGAAKRKRLGLAAVGVVAVAVAPMLVLAAAPAGLTGGAAFVAGLAALGPGGMVGGLGVVGAVGSVGGAAVAASLVQGSADAVEENVVFLQTLAKTSAALQCSQPHHREWNALQQMKISVKSDLDRLAECCDDPSLPLSVARQKLKHIDRAIAWFIKHRLAPGALSPGD